MTRITRRKLVQSGATGVLGALAAPSLALAQTKRWRMVTSWPKRLPGPGMSAERVAERIRAHVRRAAGHRGPCRRRGRAGL